MQDAEYYRDRRLRRNVAVETESKGASIALLGQDEAQVLRVLLESDGEGSVLLTNPEFLRTAISRMLMRQIANPKLSARDQRSAASQLTDLLGLDKGSKVAEVERQIKEVMERLKGEPDTVEAAKLTGK